MLSLPFLEALRMGFWPVYVIAILSGLISSIINPRMCVIKTTLAFLLASAAQWAWEGTGVLMWWQHMVIDVPVFLFITMPPRHYWQSVIGALVLAQLLAHALWYAGGDYPDAGRMHWFVCIVLGYAKCFVLVLWSGGARVEIALGRAARSLTRLVYHPLVKTNP